MDDLDGKHVAPTPAPEPGYPRRVGKMVEYAPGKFRDFSLHVEAERSKLRAQGIKTPEQLKEYLDQKSQKENEDG